uniref:Uncharacterized protein n=1 Tax=Tanacetum cinerariifolium TaxID=118510 RepID=A0A6L2LV17_TANCI|nr:hypothetical protein [Tanacetum cinerariifolium]
MSLDDLYNHLKVYEPEVQKKSDSQNMAFISTAKNSSGDGEVNTASMPTIKYEDINQIDEDDIEEMDIKWNMALLSMRADRYTKKTRKKISIQVLMWMALISRRWSALTATRWATLLGRWDWSYIANEEEDHALVADQEAPTKFELMAKSSSDTEVFNNSLCSKACKKNIDSLNTNITDLSEKLSYSKTMLYHSKLGLSHVETRLVEFKNQEIKFCEKIRGLEFKVESKTSRIGSITNELEMLKKEKEGLDSKLLGFQLDSKDIDTLLGSQRSNKNTEGLGYSAVPPPPAQVYSPPKKDMSWTRLPEFGESTSDILSKPEIKFVKATDSLTGNSQSFIDDKGYWDNGCSRHMTGNISYLSDYEPYDGGYVSFGQGGCKITGKCTIKTGKLEFENVYFVKDLKYNLFSVSQICDNKNYVLFTDSECIVLGRDFMLRDDTNVFLRTPRQYNMYSIDLNNIVPHKNLTCLVAKASADESELWHRRLGHLNFKTMNRLVRHNLVKGLPSKCFDNDHTCVACLKGKQHKASCKTKTFFLKTKDETSGILRNFITEVENLKDLKNEVAKRRNRTLIEAARTMLADAKLPVTFWAEAVNTACYVQNRVLVNKSQNKTPYELFGRTPAIRFLKPFGCHVMILNTLDHLGNFEAKGDEGYFIRYSMSSKAFRVFNKRTKRVEENLHVEFLENNLIKKGAGPNWLFDIDSLTNSMKYLPVVSTGITSTNFSGTKEAASQDVKKDVKKDVSSLRYIALLNWFHEANLEYSTSNAQDACKADAPKSSGNFNPTATSTNPLADQMETLTVKTPIPTVSSPVPTACLDVSSQLSSDTRLISKRVTGQVDTPSLDNILTLSNRFEDILRVTTSTGDSHGVEADLGNMEDNISASPTPTFRIHKDHPTSQIIGPVDTSVQTRTKSKEMEEQSFIASIHHMTNPDLLLFCLFSCFLSKEEPKKISDALNNLSLVEAMQEELLQFKIQNKIMATSTTEAEYVAAASGCGQVLWIQNQLLDYGHHFIRDCFEKKLISVDHIHTDDNVVDLLTKPFDAGRFQYLVFWSTAMIETTDEGTKILATVNGKPRTISESSIRRNLKLRDEEGISSLPDAELFENLTLMGYNILPTRKFSFPKATNRVYNSSKMIFNGMVRNVNNKVSKFLMYPSPSFSGRTVPLFESMLVTMGKGSGTPTEPHHTPSPMAQQTPHTATSSPSLPPVTTTTIPTFIPTDTPQLRQYIRRARIAQSLALPHVADEPASPIGDDSQGEAFLTDYCLEAEQDRAKITKTSTLPSDLIPKDEMASKITTQDLEISALKAMIKHLEDMDGGDDAPSGEDVTIKGRRVETGEEAGIERSTEKGSDDTEEMVNVLTSLDAASVLSSGVQVSVPPAVEVATVSISSVGEIPTISVPTGSGAVPTASSIFTTATVATPFSKRKGKEKMVELEMPKKKNLEEQVDVQMARQLVEEMTRDAQRMNEQIAMNAKIARIHAEEELQMPIDSLDRNNETIVNYLQEYEQFAAYLSIRERIELINDLVKYQDNYAKVLKYQSQQRKPLSKKQQREFYMSVLGSHTGWKTKHFKGMSQEEIREKFDPVWKQIQDFVPMGSKEEAERFKRKGISLEQDSAKKVKILEEVSEEDLKAMMQLVPVEEVYVEALQHFDREDLNQLRALVKETLNIRQATSNKEKELWVELKRLYEPNVKDQLWTQTQALMHDPVEWRLYDTCGVHHVLSKDQ